ncbi:MAG: hypothetical protein NC299_17300 [Lachnospiraceae bacterium]|nr:hypothetical protein [Ruminococcus sp.]MCM1277088.1 hypothetical protein [Lachnospiraceae bacterium]
MADIAKAAATTVENKAKRSEWYTFLNIGGSSENWVREGKFASEMTAQMNPQTTTAQDVTQDTAETDITGYQPSIAVSKSVSKSDPAFEFINEIRVHRKILSDAYADILMVDVFNGNNGGSYPAIKQPVSVQIDSFGGPASDPLTIAYTYNYRGDAVRGTAAIGKDGKVTFTAAASSEG